MADLSIEEANKIRASMGMPLLPVPGGSAPSGLAFKPAKDDSSDEEPASTVETRQAAAYGNWKKHQDEAEAKKKREERMEQLKKVREKVQRYAKIEGKGLADDTTEQDDLDWIKGAKKRQKKIAKAEQMQRELEERERQAQQALQYTEVDLAGVKVGHEIDQFDDGDDHVMVLKDIAVDADEEDELEDISLKEKERLQERLDSKKRKRAYDPNDMDESGQQSILAQYDEEIEGKKRKAFTLDGQGRTVEELQLEAGASKLKRIAINLDILKDEAPANDYMDISEVKIKKSKKKKSKSSKRKHIEDEDDMFAVTPTIADEDMGVDEPDTEAPKPKKKSTFDESFVDDDDLQAHLTAQRKKALKMRKKMRPEDVARQLLEETSAAPSPDIRDTTELEDQPALVIDETTEFVSNLHRSASEEAEEERRQRRKSSRISDDIDSVEAIQDVEGDVDMNQPYAEAAEAVDTEERNRNRSISVDVTDTGLEQEKTIDQGLGATLALLKQRGLVDTADSSDLNSQFRARQKFLAEKQRAEAAAERYAKEQRERERTTARWHNMTPREREEHSRKLNASRDQLESRKLADIFNKEYKPNINLNYVDEHGRHMNQKEAFKLLSHQFHGKGSGNTKTKKHLDKIAAEKKKMAESSLETSRAGGMSNAQDQQAKKHKLAGVRLQ